MSIMTAKPGTGVRPLPGDQFKWGTCSYKNKRGEMLPCISLFFSRNVDKQLTDVHVGQLSADVAWVLISYLQRNEISL